MALTQVKTTGLADDAVTTDKLANAINTERTANTAKTTNATHTGEVTGSGALTIADNIVDEANLKVSNAPTNGQFLSAQSGNTGGLTWAEAGGTNTPAWSVKLSGDFTTTDNTYVKITWDSEEFDTDSAFASNKFTVPANKGGYYAVMFHLTWIGAEDNETHYAALYKNGSIVNTAIRMEDTGDGGNRLTFNYFGLHNLSATDYLEVFFKDGDAGESNTIIATESVFQGFKLL